MLATVTFSQDPESVGRIILQIAIVHSKSITGKIAIDIESDVIISTVEIPNTAVIDERESDVEAGTARQVH